MFFYAYNQLFKFESVFQMINGQYQVNEKWLLSDFFPKTLVNDLLVLSVSLI